MEKADGNFEEYLKSLDSTTFKLSHGHIRYITLELFFIIQACSQLNIRHSDFQSANILVFNAQKKLKLTDFHLLEQTGFNKRMIFSTSLLCLFTLASRNYKKPKIDRNISHKQSWKNALSELFDNDEIFCNICSELLYDNRSLTSKLSPEKLEDTIEQLKKCYLEEFPALD